MMKWFAAFLSLGALVHATSSARDADGFRYVTTKKYLKMLPEWQRPVPVKSAGDHVLLVLSEHQAEQMSHAFHANTRSCGGFMHVESDAELLEIANMPESQKTVAFANRPVQFPEFVRPFISGLSTQRYMGFLTKYSQFPNRYSRSQEGVDAANFLESTAKAMATTIQRRDVNVFQIETGRYPQNSVVIRIPGVANESAIVLGGHMDTLRGTMPGVDDDGSGTAAVMEIYTRILEMNARFKNDIYLIFYAAEEVGLVGSGVVASAFQQRGIDVQAAMQLDMIGYETDENRNSLHFVRDYTDDGLTVFTKRLGQAYLGLNTRNLRDMRCNYACSDHAQWHRKGVPAVFPFEATFRGSNPRIHSSRDQLNIFSPTHAMRFVRLAGSFIVELAEPVRN
ncbi:MAG: hypothetical protein CL675_02345 [Bdellovibrionaceae bacterium]|nr:hypothetical protein [Pseudobdellovibrionaceae bacterium]